jgi:H+/gluconate symporter-like permease
MLGLLFAILAGYLAKVAAMKWIDWSDRVKKPILGEEMEKDDQADLTMKAFMYTLASLILAAISYAIPPDMLLTFISN